MSDPIEIFNAQKHAEEERAERERQAQKEREEAKKNADEQAAREQQGRAWGDK
jgi:hypothetical protein